MTNPFYHFEFKRGQFDNHCLSLVITVTHSLLAYAENGNSQRDAIKIGIKGVV